MTNYNQPLFLPKLFSLRASDLNSEKLNRKQLTILLVGIAVTLIIKFILVPYNMVDHGEGATRTWNAWFWAVKPFFVEPLSGNPGWFYFVGPILMITREIFYTPIILMIFTVTLTAYYIFKISNLIGNFNIGMLAFIIFSFNPPIFRLNFTPLPQQFFLAAMCIMIYFLIKALAAEDGRASMKYFIYAGVFNFIGLTFRPEGLFTILAFCVLALLTRKKGAWYFVSLSLLFQVIWMIISYDMYGSFTKTFDAVREYDLMTGSTAESGSILFKLKGFFFPYYYMVVGTTFILIWFFIRGVYIMFKEKPKLVFIIIMSAILIPALVNGMAGTTSNIYHTNRYYYLSFYIIPIVCAFGLDRFMMQFRSELMKWSIAGLIMATAIPLSYIKVLVPVKFNKLFPKVVQFLVTSEDPNDAWQIIKFIDENIKTYPAFIFDSEGSDSSIMYVPFRTKLPYGDNIMIGLFNVSSNKDTLKTQIKSFMDINPKGIIVFKKSPTLMNQVFTELVGPKKYIRNGINYSGETDKWLIYTYEPSIEK
jgi:hypothetical protein